MSRLRGQIPEGLSVMTRSRVVRKSLNPLLWRTWVFGWYLIRGFRYKLADRVNARSESFARWIRWPLGAGRPDRWRKVHVIRVGGFGDSLMSTPAIRLLKQIRTACFAPACCPTSGAHFTRVKQVGQVGRSLPPCPIGGLEAVASSSPNEIGNIPLRKLDGLRR